MRGQSCGWALTETQEREQLLRQQGCSHHRYQGPPQASRNAKSRIGMALHMRASDSCQQAVKQQVKASRNANSRTGVALHVRASDPCEQAVEAASEGVALALCGCRWMPCTWRALQTQCPERQSGCAHPQGCLWAHAETRRLGDVGLSPALQQPGPPVLQPTRLQLPQQAQAWAQGAAAAGQQKTAVQHPARQLPSQCEGRQCWALPAAWQPLTLLGGHSPARVDVSWPVAAAGQRQQSRRRGCHAAAAAAEHWLRPQQQAAPPRRRCQSGCAAAPGWHCQGEQIAVACRGRRSSAQAALLVVPWPCAWQLAQLRGGHSRHRHLRQRAHWGLLPHLRQPRLRQRSGPEQWRHLWHSPAAWQPGESAAAPQHPCCSG